MADVRQLDRELASQRGYGRQGRDLRLPADVIVVSRNYADCWREVRGSVVRAALSQGRVLAG